MFSLLLALIISALTRLSLADPGLGTFGVGFSGGYNQLGEGHPPAFLQSGPVYYNDRPQHPYLGYVGSPELVYIPGRVNPYSYPYHRSIIPSLLSEKTPEASSKKTRSPQTVYETLQPEIPRTLHELRQFYPQQPYEIIETYTVYNDSDIALAEELDEQLEQDKVNRNVDGVDKNKSTKTETGQDTTNQNIRMRYVGLVPQMFFRAPTPDSRRLGQPQNGIPFYPVRFGQHGLTCDVGLPPVLHPFYRTQYDLPGNNHPGDLELFPSSLLTSSDKTNESPSTDIGRELVGRLLVLRSHDINQF